MVTKAETRLRMKWLDNLKTTVKERKTMTSNISQLSQLLPSLWTSLGLSMAQIHRIQMDYHVFQVREMVSFHLMSIVNVVIKTSFRVLSLFYSTLNGESSSCSSGL